jgi:hypothetical protein
MGASLIDSFSETAAYFQKGRCKFSSTCQFFDLSVCCSRASATFFELALRSQDLRACIEAISHRVLQDMPFF